MKKLFFFLFVLAVAWAGSCKKKPIEFTLQGTITDATLGGGLSGAKVTLTEVAAGAGTPNTQIGSVILGTDGSYSFTFERKKAESYILTVSKENYFYLEKTIFFSEFSSEEPLIKNFSTTAKAWAKVRFINQNGHDLKYVRLEGKSGCDECCAGGEHYIYDFTATSPDTTFYCINDGNTNYKLYYWVLGTSDQGEATIYTTPFDTVEFAKNY